MSKIKKLLHGKTILLTGTTGYVGKVILEKIMREVPSIKRVSLLVRGNQRYPNALERMHGEILSSSIFDYLKAHQPALLEEFCAQKLECVDGELTADRFGLSASTYAELAQATDVIVNSAASVNFHEPLDQALRINTLFLNQVADFAQAAGDIPVVHISTCYVNGFHQGLMREVVVGPAGQKLIQDQAGYYQIGALLATLQEQIDTVKQQVIDPEQRREALTKLGLQQARRYGWGDAYTFTKWLGEQLILRRLQDKTLTILRPSIIESCYESPIPGWIEGVKISDAILLAYARQKVTFFPVRKAGIVDIIPVDFVANSVLLSVAETLDAPGKARIYQCCSGSQNPLVVQRYINLVCDEVQLNWQRYPRLARCQPRKKFIPVNKALFIGMIKLLRLFHTLADRVCLRSADNKSAGLERVNTTLRLSSIYANYSSPRYIFNCDQLMALAERMGDADKQLFPVDAKRIDWDRYFQEIHVAGLNDFGMEDRALRQAHIAQEALSSEIPDHHIVVAESSPTQKAKERTRV